VSALVAHVGVGVTSIQTREKLVGGDNQIRRQEEKVKIR
jgi:hypothetical protein